MFVRRSQDSGIMGNTWKIAFPFWMPGQKCVHKQSFLMFTIAKGIRGNLDSCEIEDKKKIVVNTKWPNSTVR